jgi:hypothetical protein
MRLKISRPQPSWRRHLGFAIRELANIENLGELQACVIANNPAHGRSDVVRLAQAENYFRTDTQLSWTLHQCAGLRDVSQPDSPFVRTVAQLA